VRKAIFTVELLFVFSAMGCQDEINEPEISTCIDPDVEVTPLPDVPLVRETDHLDLYSHGFICAGTALELERHVTFVADAVGVDLRTHIPVVFSEGAPTQCQQANGSLPIGCAKKDGAVFAKPYAIYHELNHSVACQLQIGVPRVLAEGFAVMYEPLPWVSRASPDSTLTELLSAPKPWYPTSGHFIRWLLERDGPMTLADLYRTPSTREAFPEALEQMYGTEFEQLEADYMTAPYRWVPFQQCSDLPRLDRDADGEWWYSAPPMDCDDSETMGPYPRDPLAPYHSEATQFALMYQSFTVWVDEPMWLDYTLDDEVYAVDFERCPDVPAHESDHEAQFQIFSMVPKEGGYTVPRFSRAGLWRANVTKFYGSTNATEVTFWQDHDQPFPPDG
jgi:hypothetical protein